MHRMNYLLPLSVLLTSTCIGVIGHEHQPHPCVRRCSSSEKPMVCRYDFTIEWYYSMSKACFGCPLNQTDCARRHCVATDGTARGIVVANRQLPGPAINVCENDEIVVHINNQLNGETTSIHWHGIHQKKGTAHMDGVPMVTQCPIQPFTKFQYRFKAEPPGTHFWHSHTGTQRTDGLVGHLIVRQPESVDPHADLYDFDLPEHVILLQDWLVEVAINRFTAHHHQGGDNKPRNILINGKGIYDGVADPQTNRLVYTPRENFNVTQGYSYRFRIISSASLNCPMLVSIDDHNLTMIASDGRPIEPFEVESFVIYGGERFDFVLAANNTVGNYWVKVQGLADCKVKPAKQTAILRYHGSDEDELPAGGASYDSMSREGVMLNPLNTEASDTRVPIVQMNATESDDQTSKEKADVTYYVGFDFNKINNPHFHDPMLYPLSSLTTNHLYTPQLNNITMLMPSSPPLYQYQDTPKEAFCDANTARNCSQTFCECVHTLQVRLGQVAEIVMVDEGVTFDASHPMHIHGYNFRVVAEGKVGRSLNIARVKEMDLAGNITRKLSRAVVKDNVIVPDGGYTAVRFYADNPGVWLLHCHISFHAEIGMLLLIQVGDPEDFPPVPRSFPRCGDYPPPVEPTDPPQAPPRPYACTPISSARPVQLTNVVTVAVLLIMTKLFKI